MDHQEISLDDPFLPLAIKSAVYHQWNEGDALFQIETNDGLEWWLFNRHGELIESFE